MFGRAHEKFLRKYLELPNGIPSHDTIQRAFGMVPSEFLENFQKKRNEMLNSSEGSKVKRLLAIDGKTQRENGGRNTPMQSVTGKTTGRISVLSSSFPETSVVSCTRLIPTRIYVRFTYHHVILRSI